LENVEFSPKHFVVFYIATTALADAKPSTQLLLWKIRLSVTFTSPANTEISKDTINSSLKAYFI
jgi:hypothetical protein